MIEIQVTLANGQARLFSCSECDTRDWTLDGRPASLDDVLAGVPRRRLATV